MDGGGESGRQGLSKIKTNWLQLQLSERKPETETDRDANDRERTLLSQSRTERCLDCAATLKKGNWGSEARSGKRQSGPKPKRGKWRYGTGTGIGRLTESVGDVMGRDCLWPRAANGNSEPERLNRVTVEK